MVRGQRYYVLKSSAGYTERGIASWYGPGFDGKRTASGEVYDMYKMTAAHKTLPLPTYVRVTNLDNGKNVVVKVNDRGPFHANRIIDLSRSAAARIGMLKKGTALVQVQAVSANGSPIPPPSPSPAPEPQHHAPAIYIQVAAYSSRTNARRTEAKLTLNAIGPVTINTTTSNGRQLYRVRVGPLLDVSIVDKITARLQQIGMTNTQVVIP